MRLEIELKHKAFKTIELHPFTIIFCIELPGPVEILRILQYLGNFFNQIIVNLNPFINLKA